MLVKLERLSFKGAIVKRTTSRHSDNVSRGSVGSATFWSMLGNSFGQAMSLLLFLVIAKFVTRESFGLMAISLTSIEIIRRLVIDPIALATNARPDATDRDFDLTFTLILLLTSVMVALVVFLAAPISTVVGLPELGSLLPMVAIILFGMGIGRTHDAWLSRTMNFRALAIRSIVSVVAGGAVGVTMALNGFDLWSLVGQQITVSLTSVAVLWLTTPWQPRLIFSLAGFAENLSQSLHISASNLWNSLSQEADIYFVSGVLGVTIAGIFSAAKRILLAASLTLIYAISAVSISTLSNISAADQRSAAAMQGLTLASLVTLPAFVGLSAIAPDLISLILEPQWSLAGQILQALAFSGYAAMLHTFCSSILMVEQRAGLNNICSVISAGATIAALWVAAPAGAIAIAWAVVASAAITLPLRLELARRVMRFSWHKIAAGLLPSIACTALMWVTTAAIKWSLADQLALVSLPLTILGAIASYGLSVLLIAPRQFALLQQLALHTIRRDSLAERNL